jgi:4-amino-4-deoxy-L-arabinose transferase-like glycosyltransferase
MLAGLTVLAAGLRLPFLAAGMGVDEGGYAYVAREWARGGHLYGSLWVDRPQGLLLAYRFLLHISDSAWAIRLGAVLAGAAVTLLVGTIGWLLRSRATGIAAAAIYAVVGVGPHIEGFTFNGELAAAVPATAAIAAALGWRRTRRRALLVAAGALGATAILMKQSGFDGLALAVVIAVAVPGLARQRLGRLGLVLGGAALPLAAAVANGIAAGWSDYWHAVVGWRVGGEVSTIAQHRPARLGTSLVTAAPDLLVLGCIALAGVVICVRRRGALRLAPLWLLVALVGFNVGGLYWPHYYVQLVAPLSLLAAIAASELRRRPARVTLVGWALLSPAGRERVVPYVHDYQRDQRIAGFLRANTLPRDTIYTLSSQGDVYFLADRRSAERYLWAHPLKEIKGGLAGLRAALAGPRQPEFVAVFRPPLRVDHSGRLASVLARNYRFRWRVPGSRAYVLQARRS